MDEVERLYNEGKLLIRAMDLPTPRTKSIGSFFECQTWVDEFDFLMRDELSSLSTTLIIPNVGVRTYKNVGFLINSNLAECFHITKEDSGSAGSIRDNTFHANPPDFKTIEELASYIKDNNAIVMNEVNINVKLDGVVGLFINKCEKSRVLLMRMMVVKKMLYAFTGKDYPIYLYDWQIGKLDRIDLTLEQEEDIIASLPANKVMIWPDEEDKPIYIPITTEQLHR